MILQLNRSQRNVFSYNYYCKTLYKEIFEILGPDAYSIVKLCYGIGYSRHQGNMSPQTMLQRIGFRIITLQSITFLYKTS